MDPVVAAAHAEDCRERLVEVLATRFGQAELAARLQAMGEDAPPGLLPTYYKLRDVLLSAGAAWPAGPWDRPADSGAAGAGVAPLFDRAFFLFGLRRSGNHAVLDWLQGHFPAEQTVFLNSADLAPFRTEGDLYSIDFGKYRDRRREAGQRILIVSYENLDPLLFPLAHNAGIAARSHAILLLRDLLNMAASIARSARDAPAATYRYRLRDFPDQWCRYAGLCLDPPAGWETISYNRWVADDGYRAGLQQRLGLPAVEVARDRVSAVGGGSSFEGTSRDGDGTAMAVLRRWEAMRDDPLFQFLLLAESEALALNARLFQLEAPGRAEWLARWQRG